MKSQDTGGTYGQEVGTRCEALPVGLNVRISMGPSAELEGVIVEHRERGRVLVRVAEAVYVEIQHYSVERTDLGW